MRVFYHNIIIKELLKFFSLPTVILKYIVKSMLLLPKYVVIC